MDMWEPCVHATRAQVSDADAKIVFDCFHCAKHLNEGVARVRCAEHRELQARGDTRLTGTRYAWLRQTDRFKRATWRAFGALRNSTLKVARAWALNPSSPPARFQAFRGRSSSLGGAPNQYLPTHPPGSTVGQPCQVYGFSFGGFMIRLTSSDVCRKNSSRTRAFSRSRGRIGVPLYVGRMLIAGIMRISISMSREFDRSPSWGCIVCLPSSGIRKALSSHKVKTLTLPGKSVSSRKLPASVTFAEDPVSAIRRTTDLKSSSSSMPSSCGSRGAVDASSGELLARRSTISTRPLIRTSLAAGGSGRVGRYPPAR